MPFTKKQLKILKSLPEKELKKYGLDKNAILSIETANDPVKWATSYLRNPEDPRQKLTLRPMQKEIIALRGDRIAIRAARRSGKSVSVAIRILHKAITEENAPILVVAPYLSQVKAIFDDIELLSSNSPQIKNCILRSVKSPNFEIEIANKSVIRGMCAGSTPGRRGSSLRGQGAKYIFVDEFDYMDEESLKALFMITKTRVDTEMFVTGTPSGVRSWFYEWCTNPKKHGFVTRHYGKEHIPSWTERDESIFRAMYSDATYAHEVLAEFADESKQVFMTNHIDQCIYDYDPDLLLYEPNRKYGIGVDWNSSETGCQIVVLEYLSNDKPTDYDKEFVNKVNGWRMNKNMEAKDKLYEKLDWSHFHKRIRVFRRISVSGSEFVQHRAVDTIIACYQLYNPVFIWVDQGFGEAQVELILKWAQDNDDRKLAKILKACNFSGTLEIQDPMGPDKIKKRFKNYMVQTAQRYMENLDLIMPMMDDEKRELVGQMRQYTVEKVGMNGEAVYSKGNDHKLDAAMLAILGFDFNHGTLTGKRMRKDSGVPLHVIPIKATERTMESDLVVTKNSETNPMSPYRDLPPKREELPFKNVVVPVPFRRWIP